MCNTLAAYHDEIRIILRFHNGFYCFAGIAGISASQALVGRDQQDELLAILMGLEKRMREIRTGIGSDFLHNLHNLLSIGTISAGCLLCMTQTRSRNHVHGTRDLLGTLYAFDALANIL